MNISVLGCGRWGSLLAWYTNKIGHKVTSYGREDSKSFRILEDTGRNEWLQIDPAINLSSDLKTSVESADIIIISIGAQGLREFLSKVTEFDYRDKIFILCMKGIEVATGKRLTEVAIESGISKDKLAVWVGPGHIQEFLKNKPNCMVIDSYSDELTSYLIDCFKSKLIRFYHGEDIIGTEVGAATKNVIGIVAGVLDGLDLVTMKGALMARGTREVARLISALGGDPNSAYGLCHLGDYETTLFSEHSHNRKWGEMFAKNQRFEKLAEGIYTAEAITNLAVKLGVDMPITYAVNAMIKQNKDPRDLLADLFERSTKKEFY